MTETDNDAAPSLPARSSNPTPFILPLVLFLLIASRYPDFASSLEPESVAEIDGTSESAGITPETRWYLIMIGFQVLIATSLLVWFRNVYFQHFPLRVSPISILVGVVGVVLWIAVCSLNIEPALLTLIGFDASRPSFDPNTISDFSVRTVFLGLRFTLLALIVPIIEELFLRGWLVRWIENPNWENVPLTGLSWGALITASLYGVLTHPSEAIAAFLWFGLVTWLMNRTGNLWDCVVAHGVTNLLLGLYVLQFQQWHLW